MIFRIIEVVCLLVSGGIVYVIRCLFDYEFNLKIEIRDKEIDGEIFRSFGKIRKVKGRLEKKKRGYLRV